MQFIHHRGNQTDPMSRDVPQFIIEHRKQSLSWNVFKIWSTTQLIKKKPDEPVKESLFQYTNMLLERMNPVDVEKMWEIYNECFEIISGINDNIRLLQMLQPQVKALYDLIPQKLVDDFVVDLVIRGEIQVPKRYADDYVPSDTQPGTREKTYIRSDYLKLIGLALLMRFMLPIWGELFSRIGKELGNIHDRRFAYALLVKSRILDTAALEKLTMYVTHNLKSDRKLTAAILAHIGTDDYVPWLVSNLVVKIVSTGQINGQEDMRCLVVLCHNAISHFTESAPENQGPFGEKVTPKNFSTGDKGDQDPSRLEGYKIKSDLTQGHISIYQTYFIRSNMPTVVKLMFEDVIDKMHGFDMDVYWRLVQHNRQLLRSPIQRCQIALMGNVCERVLSPRAAFLLRKGEEGEDGSSLIHAMTLSQAALWYNGFKRLALLQTAIPVRDTSVHRLGGVGTIARIPKEKQDRLNELYPYRRIPLSRPNAKSENPALEAIEIMSTAFTANDWTVVAPKEWMEEIHPQGAATRHLPAPHEIRVNLADLAIAIGSGRWLKK